LLLHGHTVYLLLDLIQRRFLGLFSVIVLRYVVPIETFMKLFVSRLCPTCMILQISELNCIIHLSDYSDNLFRSSCNDAPSLISLIVFQTFVSSTNNLILFLIQLDSLFTNRRNNKRPRTLPCSTPLKTSISSDRTPHRS
jgi:hypothetical protein